MSIPKNHHYISQIHIKNFFNKERREIYLYDKELENCFTKNTTKSIFSEKNLNTKNIDDTLDYSSIEKELNDNFEKDFGSNFNIIKNFIEDHDFNENVEDAILYFAKYGAISELRTPFRKKKTDSAIFKGMSIIMEMGDENLKKEFEDYFTFNNERKYTNTIDYNEFAHEVLKSMGKIIYIIEIPENENDYFLLPDFGAATKREKINIYFNPEVKEIAYIGLPLSSKIYIHFYSRKFKNIDYSQIRNISSEQVYLLNKANFEYSNKLVACENLNYLSDFTKNNKYPSINLL